MNSFSRRDLTLDSAQEVDELLVAVTLHVTMPSILPGTDTRSG
jgi:hypothetical protein